MINDSYNFSKNMTGKLFAVQKDSSEREYRLKDAPSRSHSIAAAVAYSPQLLATYKRTNIGLQVSIIHIIIRLLRKLEYAYCQL